MWAGRDEFHFVWRRLTGNFILTTHAAFVGKGVEPHRKMGWMVRASLDADSPHAVAVVHGDGLTSLQFRRTKGAATANEKESLTSTRFQLPVVLRPDLQGRRDSMMDQSSRPTAGMFTSQRARKQCKSGA
jgi:hypothetical protein